ncbi:3-keto-5-aminohexanoate cleavage protein [Litoreibacter albidus]|uniref:Uncharacterized conserved protein, DUF849 family n=1 Tax=Litoreibacter albidus TaxID=670155 RepID=A0A1H2RE51_9RHOB|nr:3-keto-5-aminohexanoate cleavage protein [Litoreibacter albidus]SDW17746.1 Uncharacterized conserved protein, DUF849 family [Litoreibacter albidus]
MKPLPKLMVAPNGARKTKADHPALPMTLEEVVETALACHAAGADGLHLHLRDAEGRHILDAGRYREALAELHRAVPDMLLQITTEAVGMYSAAQQRAIVEEVRPQAVSISLAEMLEGTDLDTAAAFYAKCAKDQIAVQHILYGAQDLTAMSALLDRGGLEAAPLQLLFVLGRYTAGQESAPSDLDPFIRWMGRNCASAEWGVCAFGKRETECLTYAHGKGGNVRIGFENSFWNSDGTVATSNAERVLDFRRVSEA